MYRLVSGLAVLGVLAEPCLAGAANILVLSWLMYRDKRAHPAYLSAAIGSLVKFTAMAVGNMQWWRSLADSLFTI